MAKHYTLCKEKNGSVKLKNDLGNYTHEIYRGELTDYYSILEHYEIRFSDAWIDSYLPGIGTGHLMTIYEWVYYCDEEFFIDYDGYGSILNENYEEIAARSPSQRSDLPEGSKFILWYNK